MNIFGSTVRIRRNRHYRDCRRHKSGPVDDSCGNVAAMQRKANVFGQEKRSLWNRLWPDPENCALYAACGKGAFFICIYSPENS